MYVGYSKKKLRHKKASTGKGAASSGMMMVTLILITITIALALIGGQLPQLDNRKVGDPVAIITPAPDTAKDSLQLIAFQGATLTPVPTSTPPPNPTPSCPPQNSSNNPSAAATTFADGDVFVSYHSGVKWYHADGTLVKDLDMGPFDPNSLKILEGTGMAFDTAGNLYVTTFSRNSVRKYDNSGNFIGNFGSGYTGKPESIVFDNDGNAYVSAATGGVIRKFDSSGNFKTLYNPQSDVARTDWIDLTADQCTIYFTTELNNIQRYNVCTNTKLSDFNTVMLPGNAGFALRILPTGGVLVAGRTVIVRLDTQGKQIKQYDVPGHDFWFALNLDPDGKSFWSASMANPEVYKFDIETGNVLNSFNTNILTGALSGLFGLTVKGEITAARPCAGTTLP